MTKIHISTGFVKDLLAPRVNLQDVRGGTVFTQGSGRLLHTSSVSSRYATSSVHWGALSFLTLFLHLLCIWEIKKRQASVRLHSQFRRCCSIPVFSSVLTTADKYCMSSFVAIRRWCFCLRLQLVRHTLDCVTFFSFRLCWGFFGTFFCQTLLMQYIIKVDTGAKDWLFRGWDRKLDCLLSDWKTTTVRVKDYRCKSWKSESVSPSSLWPLIWWCPVCYTKCFINFLQQWINAWQLQQTSQSTDFFPASLLRCTGWRNDLKPEFIFIETKCAQIGIECAVTEAIIRKPHMVILEFCYFFI